MTNNRKFSKKLLAVILSVVLLMSYLPVMTASAAETSQSYYNKVADASTMDGWKNYFPITGEISTANAGGVWTDKSVFTDASAFNGNITMLDSEKNFLTALSAIAANKEVVGYSTVPTDTVFILDLSNSMPAAARTQLINATNAAIESLQSINNNNRVGVVLYSGSSSVRTYSNAVASLMPIDRYTTTMTSGGNDIYIEYENGEVKLADNRYGTVQVTGSNGAVVSESKDYGGATYIQAGLWEAYKMFDAVSDNDIYIGNNNWQSGDYRMPIVVLMTDGAPTLGTSYFADVENSTYGYNNATKSNVGDGSDSGITAGQGFLVQLTASYIKNRIENKYKVHSEKGAGRSLFYTLGFNITPDTNPNNVTSGDIAYSVVNPDASTITDSLWNTYNGQGNTMQVTVEGRSGGESSVTITKNSYATSKSYVDEYFSASGTGLRDAFDDIVEEIILQSRYYPTHLEGGSPDFSGYITFTDELGEYMEVKHINGILLGDTLFDGHMMASKLADTSENGLGTPEAPTELGNEFIWAVQARLGISDVASARALVAAAYNADQICYKTENGGIKWSNYIGWYADAAGSYVGHWDENSTAAAPANAVYKVKSYGFLGETTGSIKNSDMMYMSVQVKQSIATGKQTVTWKIPAALVPMITYKVSLTGANIDVANDVNVTIEDTTVTPIRLVYETGLRSDLNEFNITRITAAEHIAADGHTRIFWNNYFDISAASHDEHKTTMSEFTPNKENERFYFTFDSAVHKKVGNNYEIVGHNETPDPNGEYYHRRYVFTTASSEPIFLYEKMSSASIEAAVANGWKDSFESLEHQTVGAWVVPKGTPARELQMYDLQKTSNPTNSAHMVFHPYISEHNNTVYVDMNLGNNGLLSVTPATGIKISKTVDIFEEGTSDSFRFRLTVGANGSYNTWITALDETPTAEPTVVQLTNGTYEFTMKKDQTFWITGIPAGTAYSVDEISTNDDYKIKSVHVNGTVVGRTATGNVSQYLIDDVDFVNTAVGEGDLVITKRVEDENGNIVNVNDSVEFTAEVTLTKNGNPVSGTFEATGGSITVPANGKFTVTLSDGESFVVRGIPEETAYTVVETNIPNGFTFNADKSVMSGVIDATANDQALIVNTYKPTRAVGDGVEVIISKEISGNRTDWLPGENYSFNVERVDASGNFEHLLLSVNIPGYGTGHSTGSHLYGENYDRAGTYYYRITETVGNQGGITYDTAERRFSVQVADSDMDGDLEIVAVNNESLTTVSGRWLVTAAFNNVYAPTGSATTVINIEKAINAGHSLAGFQFALYDKNPVTASDANELIRSGLTDAAGKASISLTYAANRATMNGVSYTYYLAEVKGTNPNITYDTTVYEVTVTLKDNGDGTVSATNEIAGTAAGDPALFTNVYTPSASDFITFSGKKVISTGNRILNANEFEFILEGVGSAPMPATATAKNLADGSFAFGEIEFTAVGDYTYYIYENDTDKIGGFTYDDAVYTVVVRVTDNGNATLTAAILSIKEDGVTNVDDIVFENAYDPTDAVVSLGGTKQLVGKIMRGGEFEFEISALTSGAPLPLNTTVRNDENGRISFGDITYDKAGTYLYTVKEKEGGNAQITYDRSVYTVTVTVTDNSEGLLTAVYTMTKDNMPSSEIYFTNGFTPKEKTYDIYAEFGGQKNLTGKALRDGEFEFKLINAITGEQVGETVRNDANGKIEFPTLTFTVPGTYHYKVSEVIGDESGISYDPVVYHVVIGVAQLDDANSSDDGNLTIVRNELHEAHIVIDESSGTPVETVEYVNVTANGSITFENSYKAAPAEIKLGGKKVLAGRALEEGEFTFNLYHAVYENNKWKRGDLVEQTVNDADGSFEFATRISDENAEYIYFITEDATDPDPTVTYDTKEYMVKVTSSDNLDGTRTLTYEYSVDGEAVTEVVFTNTYTAPAPTPDTGDDGANRRDLWMLLAVAFVSLIGITVCGYTLLSKKSEEK